MKKLPFLLLLFAFSACNSVRDSAIEFKSENGKVKISVVGKRILPMDPLATAIKIKAYSFEEQILETEVQVKNFSTENVQLIWSDETHAILTLVETDGNKKVFQLLATETQVQLVPVAL